jgi:hypothetical protein
MPIPTPFPQTESLRDLPPLPIFAYVPSLIVWGLLGAALISAWIWIARSRRGARGGAVPSALEVIEREIERAITGGAPREALFSVSRSLKILLQGRERGDFTTATPRELEGAAHAIPPSPLLRVVQILAAIDRAKFEPNCSPPIAELKELRTIVGSVVSSPPSAPRKEEAPR